MRHSFKLHRVYTIIIMLSLHAKHIKNISSCQEGNVNHAVSIIALSFCFLLHTASTISSEIVNCVADT